MTPEEEEDGARGSRSMAYKAAFLVDCLHSGSLLTRTSGLREVLTQSCRMALPDTLRDDLAWLVMDRERFAVPHHSTISRRRLLLDTAYMLWYGQKLMGTPVTTYCMIDSSTQGGRDYELILVSQLDTSALPQLYDVASKLISLRRIRVAQRVSRT